MVVNDPSHLCGLTGISGVEEASKRIENTAAIILESGSNPPPAEAGPRIASREGILEMVEKAVKRYWNWISMIPYFLKCSTVFSTIILEISLRVTLATFLYWGTPFTSRTRLSDPLSIKSTPRTPPPIASPALVTSST